MHDLGKVIMGILVVIVVGTVVVIILAMIAAGENCKDRGGTLVGGYDGYTCVERQ